MKLTIMSRFSATLVAVMAHFKLAQFVDFYQWTPLSVLMTLVVAFEHKTVQNKPSQEVFLGQITAVFSMIELQSTFCCGILNVFTNQLCSYVEYEGALTWPIIVIMALKHAYWWLIYKKFANIDEMLLVMLPLCN